MKEAPVSISDFDIVVSDIYLVHQAGFDNDYKFTAYRSGRMIDGLVYCISGGCLFDFGQSSVTLSAGQALFIPANCAYVSRCISDEPFVHYTANFKLAQFQTSSSDTSVSEVLSGSLHMSTNPNHHEKFSVPFDNLHSLWQIKSFGYRLQARALISELLYKYFIDIAFSVQNDRDYRKIRPAVRYLDEHYTEAYAVGYLANLCGMSETNFRRIFTKLLGTSPVEYRICKQIEKAKDLMLSGEYSITKAARLVGFEEPNYFSRIFKEREGKSPRAFLNDLK